MRMELHARGPAFPERQEKTTTASPAHRLLGSAPSLLSNQALLRHARLAMLVSLLSIGRRGAIPDVIVVAVVLSTKRKPRYQSQCQS